MRILVTGSNGFVGRHLVQVLAANQIEVLGLDRNHCPNAAVQTIHYNLGSNSDTLHLSGLDCIVHLASTRKHNFSHANIEGTRELLQAALKCHVNKVVMLGTAEIGNWEDEFLTEKKTPTACTSELSASRACQELIAMSFVQHSDLPLVLVRSVNIFGEGQRDGLIPYFCKQALGNLPVEVYGKELLQWVHVSYVCSLLSEVAVATQIPPGTVLHTGGTKEIYSSTLAASIVGILSSKSEIKVLNGKTPRFSMERTDETDRFLLDHQYDDVQFLPQLRSTVEAFAKG